MMSIFEQILRKTQEEYKDSQDARYEKEDGNPNEDVFVKDRFTNGQAITFVWNRNKSNENVSDPGEGKEGFSFYQARYIYRDPYLLKGKVKTSNPGGISAVGTVFKGDKKVMVVIQEKIEGKDEEGDPIIRIFSATYANTETQLDYFKRAFEKISRDKGEIKRLEESSGNNDFIARTTIEHRNRYMK